ncbi:MAG: glycosyltransferase family 39 protein [Acidobacteriota bacterium]
MFRLSPSKRTIDVCVATLLVCVAVGNFIEAADRPLWYDEIFTVVLARLPTMDGVMAALGSSVDTSGPVFHALVRLTDGWVLDVEARYRLLSVVGSTVTYAALYVFARRDLGPVAGLITVLVMLLSRLHHGYDVEARAYALMVMFIAVGAVAWQRAASWPWTIALGISAALAVGTHYYSVFAGVPFVVAELVHSVRKHHVRLQVWAALAMGGLSLWACWPLLSGLRVYYGLHYWAKPSVGRAVEAYDYLAPTGVPGAGFGIAVALGIAMLVLFVRVWPNDEALDWSRPAPETLVFVMMLLAIPFVAIAAAAAMNGGFTHRYALGMLPGVGLSVAFAARALDSHMRTLVALGLLSVLASRELAFWGSRSDESGLGARARFEGQMRAMAEAKTIGMGLPVVVDNGLDCLPLAFYDAGPVASEPVCLTDPEAARRYIGTDSLDLDLIALKPYVRHQIVDFGEFRSQHREFLLLSHFGAETWWPTRLVDERYTLTVVSRSSVHALYRVTARAVIPES